ncbi:14384_t:CDS:2 [Dentiscutata heterogama]|uniref:14384_t:CDS:1 n=1 Tax=Dentiscutata heterogama TaxID=1316150 RepID=A0ACA9JUU6_9GLOM|nr:14384_t:CDS:2 [Dentiscutata heterogama]
MAPVRKKKTVKTIKGAEGSVKTTRKSVPLCHVGYCGNVDKYNACRKKRTIGTEVDEGKFGVIKDKAQGRCYFWDTIFSNITVSNTASTIELPTKTGTTNIVGLMEPMTIRFFIVQICDEMMAKKKSYSLEELFVDINELGDRLRFRDPFKPIAEEKLEFSCDTRCDFQTKSLVLCADLNHRICVLSRNTGENIVYTEGNFMLAIVIDYSDWMYKMRLCRFEGPERSLFGNEAKLELGYSGISAFISGGSIEAAWRLDPSSMGGLQGLFSMLKKCCDKDRMQVNT